SEYESFYIKFLGDTLIKDVTSKKVYRSDDSLMTEWHLVGSIRETDTASVFFLPANEDKEILLMDFDVIVGDSIYLTECDTYIRITSISYEPFGLYNETRKHIYFQSQTFGFEDVWIEGVGSRLGILFNPGHLCYIGETNNLVCFWENDSLKYHFSYFPSCFMTGVYSSNNLLNNDLSLEILNEIDAVIFNLNERVMGYLSFSLYDISGRMILNENVNDKTTLRVEKNSVDAGIYLYSIETRTGSKCGKILIK
ncbi:MAG: T9SS type A sorting domain-containing protein, partial [Bacteroidales bacterium]|nr:T9SS type A sorting domain-containing protein [Bacteroidales bacterium]